MECGVVAGSGEGCDGRVIAGGFSGLRDSSPLSARRRVQAGTLDFTQMFQPVFLTRSEVMPPYDFSVHSRWKFATVRDREIPSSRPTPVAAAKCSGRGSNRENSRRLSGSRIETNVRRTESGSH